MTLFSPLISEKPSWQNYHRFLIIIKLTQTNYRDQNRFYFLILLSLPSVIWIALFYFEGTLCYSFRCYFSFLCLVLWFKGLYHCFMSEGCAFFIRLGDHKQYRLFTCPLTKSDKSAICLQSEIPQTFQSFLLQRLQ